MTEVLTQLARRLADWRVRRAAIAELRRYDDALLADLGIRREEIADYVAGRCGPAPAPRRPLARPERIGANVVRLFPAGDERTACC